MGLKHSFVSEKSDGGDATLVRPSDWNAMHVPHRLWMWSGVSDFLFSNAYMNPPWYGAAISSGTCPTRAGNANHPGVTGLRSSTTANGGYRFTMDVGSFLLAGGENFEIIFYVRTLTGCTMRFGFLDTTTSSDATDGVYFEIPSTGALVGKTSNNSTRSTTGTSYTVSTSTWYRARLVLNSGATQVDFYLYNASGTQLWTNSLTTNIPKTAGRETGNGIVATESSTTAYDIIDIDWMAVWINRDLTG